MAPRAVAVFMAGLSFGLIPTASSAQLSHAGDRPKQVAQWPPGQWSMLQNVPEHRGYTPLTGSQTSTVLWQYTIQTNYGGAAIARDGTIYQADSLGRFYAFNPDGTVKWTISTFPYSVEVTPALLPDGRVVILNSHGTVLVLNPDGSQSWVYRTGFDCACNPMTPTIGRDGTIFFFAFNTEYALNPDGTVRWTYDVGNVINGSPAIRSDGVVYVPGIGLYALSPDGRLLWHSGSFVTAGSSPAIGPDGTIYVNANFPTALYAIRPNGARKWRYTVVDGAANNILSSPAVGPDGTIYVGETLDNGTDGDGIVLALNPDGTLKWEVHYGHWPTAIAVGGDGTIYFGSGCCSPPSLYALNPDGSLKWQYEDSQQIYIRTPPAIGKDQRVYVGGVSSFVAIGP